MTGGRPTTYNKAILEKSNKYLKEWKNLGHAIPSVEGLCKHLDRSRSTLYRWGEDERKKDFWDILDKVNEQQKFELLNGGLLGDLNSNIVKLALGKHGFHDKTMIGGDSENPLTITEVKHTIVDPEHTSS